MTVDGKLEPIDYAYALMDVAKWIKANAMNIIGNDISDVKQIDLHVKIEPLNLITVEYSCNRTPMIFKDGKPLIATVKERTENDNRGT